MLACMIFNENNKMSVSNYSIESFKIKTKKQKN